MPTEDESPVEALRSLGLTPLEAETYVALVRNPGITGYGIAKQLQKPTANIYKALEGLTAKGAAITEIDTEKRYTAVPPEEFVRRFEITVRRVGQTIVDQFKNAIPHSMPDAIYSLHTIEQAEERISFIIRNSTSTVVVDASPQTLDRWAPHLETAGHEKSVLIKAYEQCAVAGCSVFIDPRGEEIQQRWRTQWFHIVGDGVEALLSIYTGDALARGIWTREPLIAVIYHEALTSELILTGLTRLINEDKTQEQLREFLEANLSAIRLDIRGFDRLFSRFESVQKKK